MIGPREIKFHIDHVTEEASVEVDGANHKIEFDMDAITVYYEVFKQIPLTQSIDLHPRRIAGLLYSGLLRHQPEIEATLVQSWFVPRHLLTLYEGTIAAFKMDKPEQRPGEEGDTPNPPNA